VIATLDRVTGRATRAAACLAACTLTTDLDGLAGASDRNADPDSGEAPPPPAHGSARDAAPGGSFCATQVDALFWDDFERTTPLGSWDSLDVEGSGVATIVRAEGNGFLRAQVPAAHGTTRALLNKQFDAVPKKFLRYEFGLEPKVIDANAGIGYSDPSPDLQVDIDDAALYVE